MKKTLCALSILFVLAVTQANAAPFGFAADNGGTYITQGYQGFNYSGGSGDTSWVNDTSDPIDSSYGIGPTALGAAWSNGGTNLTLMSSVSGNLFDLFSLSLNVGYTESVTLQGLLNGSVVDSWTGTIVNNYAYTDVGLNWTGIDQVNFSEGANLFVTNIDTSHSVPEPATMLLLSLGLAGLAGAKRKLKK